MRDEIEAFAEYLRSLSPQQRIEALDELHEEAGFCFVCGFVEQYPHACHCDNDE
jgi:hypothetical protein